MSESYFDLVKENLSEMADAVKENRVEQKELKGLLLDRLAENGLFRVSGVYDDAIEVAAGTKTLLGEDFASLYESSSTVSMEAGPDGSGGSVSIIQSTCSYPTEMHSGNLRMGTWTEYSQVPVEKRAAYEVTLLTKKYAAMEDTDANAGEYADKMAHYRQACESQGLSWDTVIGNVSGELQTEVADFKELSSGKANLYEAVSGSSAKARAQAADAHNMLMECLPEGYQMQILPALTGKVTQEDLSDASYEGSAAAKGAGFLAAVHTAFTYVYEKLPHPIRWVRSAFCNMKDMGERFADNTRAMMDEFDERHEAWKQEQAEVMEQFQGVKDDISATKPGQALEGIGDAVKEEIPQAFDDPSQEIQDLRDWAKEKAGQAAPYLDAAGNAVDAMKGKASERIDDFVEKWASPEYQDGAEDDQQYAESE